MSEFVILSDPSCDLSLELRERFGVAGVIPSFVTYPDGHSEEADLDWKNISSEAFFKALAEHPMEFKTAAAGPDLIVDTYRPFLEAGKDILIITLSSGVSSTYQNCLYAAEMAMEQYPGRRIVVVDSMRYSTALSLMLVYAHRQQAARKSLLETADWLEKHNNRFHEMGPLDDLFFLSRVGRVSAPKAVMGTLVGIKPLADFDLNGKSQVIGKAKGYNRAFRATIGYIKETIENPEEQIIFVAHSNRLDKAQKLVQMIEEEIRPKEVILNSVGQACGVNIGPGLIAAFYYGKPITEGLAEETQLLNRLLK